MHAAALFCAAVLLLGCGRGPAYYAPPSQFVMPSQPDPVTQVRLVKMNHPDAPFSIIDGVLDAGSPWGFKWTLQRARFELIAGDVANDDLFMRYALDPRTFHDRGSIRVTIAIDGKAVYSFTEGTIGVHEQRHPAAGLKSKDVETLELSLTVDPPWTDPTNGSKLGVYLDEIGFVPRT